MTLQSKSPGVCLRYEVELVTAVSLLRIDRTNRQPGDFPSSLVSSQQLGGNDA